MHFPKTDITVKNVKLLSEGAFAYVYLVKRIHAGPDEYYALKKITPQQDFLTTQREIAIWEEIGQHDHTCTFIDAKLQSPADDDGFNYVLCEYCDGGTLVNYLMKHDCKLSEVQIANCTL